ncbi:hypothetical protein ABIA48_005151 [Pseudomonas sp. S30_BP2TU TE3576]|jgi:hypothetical protein|uniref:hypothetical protein n=1 Tax=Pseudomonas sp. S30_BP2TU TE3576 TaxID=3349329 RepID=UPI003D1CB97D
MPKLKDIETQLHDNPDQQTPLTAPDARSTAKSGRGTKMVGYNPTRMMSNLGVQGLLEAIRA